MAKSKTSAPAMKVKTTWKNAFKRDWQLYLLLLIPLALVFLFSMPHIRVCGWYL